MSRLVCVAAILLCVGCAAASTYPATYPYDNEQYKPPTIPQQTDVTVLKGKIGKGDPGGYIAAGMYQCDPFKNEGLRGFGGDPKNWACMATHLSWVYNFKGKPATRAINCTKEFDKVMTKDMFPGVIDNKKICTDCCKGRIGVVVPPSKIDDEHAHFNQWSALGSCAVMTEEAYCSFVTHFMYTCTEMYQKGESVRPFAVSCPDVLVKWLLSCTLYKNTGVAKIISSRYKMEPDEYLASLTAEQTLVARAGINQPDRACQTYSYFNPDSNTPPSSAGVNYNLHFVGVVCFALLQLI